jgi:maltose O-acetyltransferase
MEEIIYSKGVRRPSNSKYQRILFKLLKMPIVQRYVQTLLKRSYNLPPSTHINKGFYCTAPLLKIENNVSLADTFIVAWAPIIIGKGTSFSYKNTIINSTHDIDDFYNVIGKPVIIGSNTWITSNCTILGGVTIGSNTIIGAGSVVTRDIPSGVFAAGNPCKVIKPIYFRMNNHSYSIPSKNITIKK